MVFFGYLKFPSYIKNIFYSKLTEFIMKNQMKNEISMRKYEQNARTFVW